MKYLPLIAILLLISNIESYSQACEWRADDWGPCEGECGSEMQTRNVICQCDGETVPDINCDSSTKPATIQSCAPEGEYVWVVGDWSSCSVECGDGVQTREVYCESTEGIVLDDCYCSEDKPSATQPCNLGVCGVGVGVTNPTATLHVNGTLRFEDGNEGQDRILLSDAEGNASWQALSSINGPESSILVTTFSNNYTHYGSGFQDVSYYKHNGRVFIEGVAGRAAGVINNQTIFTLPLGYRPAKAHLFEGRQGTTGCRIDILSTGEVRVIACEQSGSFIFISLSGISFRI
ncbi:thrombospondin type-1 domain-containing protein [Portibacter marinus]|uniref:thrombospondin type-1 domain-containing protein n=1 Tax=Portibacter marinus TaxID=2898660 RepID=UPI001F388C2E|nr:thrombospondin type-1 domain-containing protein [Portibacter marinus]